MLTNDKGERLFEWAYKGDGYEVSSVGDVRFSAFCAKMDDSRSLEMHYQCDVKGYQPGGTNWRLGKSKKPALILPESEIQTYLWTNYLALWRRWAQIGPNMEALRQLRYMARLSNYLLTDKFANTPINQAHALAELLNEGIDL